MDYYNSQYSQQQYAQGQYGSQQQQAQYGQQQAYPAQGYTPQQYHGAAGGGGAPRSFNEPSRSIYVGNVDAGTSDAELFDTFVRFGPIENAKIVPERLCAFVNFMDLESAMVCFNTKGIVLHGQEVRLNWGKPQGMPRGAPMQRPGGGASSGGYMSQQPMQMQMQMQMPMRSALGTQGGAGGGGLPPTRTIWVGNLSPMIDESGLTNAFVVFPGITSVRVMHGKGFGFVTFDTVEHASTARTEMNGKLLMGQYVRTNNAKDLPADFDPQYSHLAAQSQTSFQSMAQPAMAAYNGNQATIRPPNQPAPLPQSTARADGNWNQVNAAAPPADPELREIIEKTAAHVTSHGTHFEAALMVRTKGNPQFTFLTSGPNAAYYQWMLQCYRKGGVPSKHRDRMLAMDRVDEDELRRILRQLEGTKDSIRNAKEWIVKHGATGHGISSVLRSHVEQQQEVSKMLNVVYLINDIFYTCSISRASRDDMDDLTAAICKHLKPILKRVYDNGETEKIDKVLGLWETKYVLPASLVASIRLFLRGQGGDETDSIDDMLTALADSTRAANAARASSHLQYAPSAQSQPQPISTLSAVDQRRERSPNRSARPARERSRSPSRDGAASTTAASALTAATDDDDDVFRSFRRN